ncbi:MAG: valine--tRNA ligase [Candidatus Hydrogenedentota bacterium]
MEIKRMETRYNPASFETKWYNFWLLKRYFHSEIDPGTKPYVIVIPPPNVTGVLHMGHGLNNTIQDILIRMYRKLGFNTCWVPGTDHAGIATQNVVEKKLLSEGKTRESFTRSEFLNEVWKWKEEHGSTIIKQLKRLGALCDWERERFTMDEGLSRAVKEVFIRLFENGLVYRDEYIINWCVRCKTALSDEEVEYKETTGKLYYIKYPLENNNNYIIVATTRPETMLGDTAVAVHPDDNRYKQYWGKYIILPLMRRKIPLICDSVVLMEFGTGAVKVTPSHDPNDFEIGKRHNLQFINILNPDGTLNNNVAPYNGLDRFRARERVIEDLKKENLIEKIESYKHSVGHCYRCDTVIEPYISKQWFVKMRPLAEPAIDVVKKERIKFYPSRWRGVYLNWMENIKDWCISRQIWWGHRIPVWYCKKMENEDCRIKNGVIVRRDQPKECPYCGATELVQDADVLDTWFSSALWPFSTLGWPEETEELKYYYPTTVLVTDPGIIFFWVARMIMMGLFFMKEIPFSDVYIHGTVMDAIGRKMSKSLGNGIDPLEVIDKYGADALRFTITAITPTGQNLLLSMDKFSIGQNFANKLWNAARFLKMKVISDRIQTIDLKINTDDLSFMDRWILSLLDKLIEDTEQNLRIYKLNEIAMDIYAYFWHEYCDWYLEFLKIDIRENTSLTKRETAIYIFNSLLSLLHPFIPFITEEIYQSFPHSYDSIMITPFPAKLSINFDKEESEKIEYLKELINGIRNIRSIFLAGREEYVGINVEDTETTARDLIKEYSVFIKTLAKVKEINFLKSPESVLRSAIFVTKYGAIGIPLSDKIKIDKQYKKLLKEKEIISRRVIKIQSRLNNKDFLSKAPFEICEQTKEDLDKFQGKLKRIEESLKMIERIYNK